MFLNIESIQRAQASFTWHDVYVLKKKRIKTPHSNIRLKYPSQDVTRKVFYTLRLFFHHRCARMRYSPVYGLARTIWRKPLNTPLLNTHPSLVLYSQKSSSADHKWTDSIGSLHPSLRYAFSHMEKLSLLWKAVLLIFLLVFGDFLTQKTIKVWLKKYDGKHYTLKLHGTLRVSWRTLPDKYN